MSVAEYGPRVFEQKGGYTQVQITPPGEERSFEGHATCSPKDSWNRRLGLTIALGRALKAYGWKGKAA